MFKLAPYAAAAAAAVAVASPASAALTVTQDPDPCVAGATVCTFDFDGVVTVDGAFAQSAAFTLPDAGAFNGGLLTTAISASQGNIDFSRVYLIAPDMTEIDLSIGSLTTLIDFATLGLTNVEGGAWSLNVEGTLAGPNGGYGGDLTFAAVPEPGTWALMLLGFGLVGFALRRREPAISKVRVRYV